MITSRRAPVLAIVLASYLMIVLDISIVTTGSFNFTRQAEQKNAENLLVLRSRQLAKAYIENWEKHWKHSERNEGR
jgi:phosphatidylserine/phosphatidylglycerophosphate/cardiolipin synthase-like enzyme